MDIFNITSPSPRPAVTIDLSPLVGGVTWSGQQFYNGTAVGQESMETAAAANVTVQASEGVLVFLQGGASGAGNGTSTGSTGGSGSGGSGGQTSGARKTATIFGWWKV
ncbi:glycoside hydrolase family 79 protein [Calocera cornea HHB12733]|uniref:Glycoside hydrolase family 79 protein n=1 Tax=Calocera cornea HHB12733 TaxID=1353952 RepID=A0A165DAS5_9BASI|nr:glycoside hydrolase family 79 protein [Calocera cornea HHB12733]